ncbi:MAG: hypothetical protein JO250_04340 [Armatimonadetes bacterium]|nr:hypothetical protein [Armatimonadota bacterium]
MRRQRGATLVLTALSLTAMLGVAALAVDLGVIYGARRRAQAVADAAALAGGPLLPNTAQAATAANGVIAANNGGGGAFVTTGVSSPTSVTRDDGTTVTVGPGGSLMVQGYVNAPLAFGPAVGFGPSSRDGAANTLSVPAQAAVVTQNACGLPSGVGVAPFGLIGDDPNSSDPTARYVATLLSTAANAQTPSPKTYQPTAGLILRQNVWSNGTLVFAGDFDPTQLGGSQGYASSINNTSDVPLTAGQSLSTQASATISLTQQYLGARLSPSNAQFRHDYATYTDWFFGDHTQPVDTSQPPVTDPNTGQTYYYHVDPHRQELTDAHVLIVPVIQQSSKNGTGPVTILAFAAFFVEQIYANKNNNAIAQGRFIGLTLPTASAGDCTGAGDRTPPRLVR